MPDGISHGQERLSGYDRSPVEMPKTWVIAMLQECGAVMQQRAMMEGDLSAQATADALFSIASGYYDAACECVQSAGALRRRRA